MGYKIKHFLNSAIYGMNLRYLNWNFCFCSVENTIYLQEQRFLFHTCSVPHFLISSQICPHGVQCMHNLVTLPAAQVEQFRVGIVAHWDHMLVRGLL